MPAPKNNQTEPNTENTKTEPKTEAGTTGEEGEAAPDPLADLTALLGNVREELASIREDMGSLRGVVDGMKGQLELGASIAAEGNPGESEEGDYPEIDLDEIARMTGDM